MAISQWWEILPGICSPVPPLMPLLLLGATRTAPDAGLGEINSARVVWLSSPASFACLVRLSFLSLELPDFYTAPYLCLPKPCASLHLWGGVHLAGTACGLVAL